MPNGILISKPSNLMAGIKGFAWNCGGLRRTTASTLFKVMFFEKNFKNNFDFFFFLETHHKNEDDIPNELARFKDSHHIHHSEIKGTETHAGIITLTSKKYSVTEVQHIMQGRILSLKITDQNTKIVYKIIAVYLQTNNNLNKEIMKDIVGKLRINNQHNEFVVILGDFNFIDHPKDKKNGLSHKDQQLNEIWTPFVEEMDLVDPFREQNPNRKVWSFIGTGVAGNSRIDRIYVNTVNMREITNIKYIQTPFHGHKILSYVINNNIQWGKGYYKLNTSLFEEEEYDKIVDETIREVNLLTSRTSREKWEIFMMAMKTKSIRYSTTRNYAKRKLKDELIRQMSAIEEKKDEENFAEHYAYLKGRLKEIEDKEIDGYIKRLKFLAPYEKAETDISFYSKLEGRKRASDRISQLAEKKDAEIFTDQENIMRISTDFYKNLYSSGKVHQKIQEKLLRNVKTKLSKEAKDNLDKPITAKEVEDAIHKLPLGKSPGLDGFPVEFYRAYWPNIKDLFMAYLEEVRRHGISNSRNVSVIKLLYKKKGEIFLLQNYRPISLLNVDVKIITKVLADRLNFVLPSIIHATQTAIYGRKIDQNIHLIRDLIELANTNDDTAAFIFLDQEKAFDRVNHDFMFKTMKTFGFGDTFINWVKNIYSNATSVLSINGFFSNKISFDRGVRQGCPLSALLYVLVIEILAIQLRNNPNIVGFQIEGEKIVSVHYMDDTTIIIKQNRCFKEVIKELELYEMATEAKVNYAKTKGLWTGSWKGRRVSPMNNIQWSSTDVENLGIYFGNENPGFKTFQKIVTKFKKRLAYWKQFTLSKIGKARVTEMFLASKLVYAMKFYPIPVKFQQEIQNSIFKYVNFPNKVITIGQKEMWKIKTNGGCKLVNIQVKSETSKAKWLMEIATNPNFKINLSTFTSILGVHKGNTSGRDIIFAQGSFITRVMKVKSQFYREALNSLAIFHRRKGIPTAKDWDNENLFYNPSILGRSGKTLKETEYFRANGIFKLGQILREAAKEARGLPYDKIQANLAKKLTLDMGFPGSDIIKDDTVLMGNTMHAKMASITQKELYEEAILIKTPTKRDNYQNKWTQEISSVMILWDEVWASVHNRLLSNKTKTAIWEQLHLNFYTQYSYNKWHKTINSCTLCGKDPTDIYHIILHCDFTNTIFTQIEPALLKLFPNTITREEKAFGIVNIKNKPAIMVRNWLTYKIREVILDFERKAYHNPKVASVTLFKAKFNQEIASEVKKLLYRFKHENRMKKFDEIVCFGHILCEKVGEEYRLKCVFD